MMCTPENEKRGVMYQVPCKHYNRTYIGETKRTLRVRLGEHKQAVRRGDPTNGITVHEIDWDDARVKSITPCLLYTSPSPRDRQKSRMPSSA